MTTCDVDLAKKDNQQEFKSSISEFKVKYQLFGTNREAFLDSQIYRLLNIFFFKELIKRLTHSTSGVQLLEIFDLSTYVKNIIQNTQSLISSPDFEPHDSYLHSFLQFKYLACYFFYSDKPVNAETLELLSEWLSFHVSNPFLYLFMIFSVLDRNLTYPIQYSEIKYLTMAELKEITDPKIFEMVRCLRSFGAKQCQVLTLYIKCVAGHFTALQLALATSQESLKRERSEVATPRKTQLQRRRIRKNRRTHSALRFTYGSVESQCSISQAEPKRLASLRNITCKQGGTQKQIPSSFNLFSVTSKTSATSSYFLNEPPFNEAKQFLKQSGLVEYLPNLELAKSTLVDWTTLAYEFTNKKGMLLIGEQLTSIVYSIITIETVLRSIFPRLRLISKAAVSTIEKLEPKIKDTINRLLLESKYQNVVEECVHALNYSNPEAFPVKLSQ